MSTGARRCGAGPSPLRDCPQPGKMAFATESDVWDWLRRELWEDPRNRLKPVRVYRCRCGSYHYTSKPLKRKGTHDDRPTT